LRYILSILCISLYACTTHISFPEGGYAYPAHIERSTYDSFKFILNSSYWQSAFKEPDLSIQPQKKVTVRLTFETAFGESYVISMTNDEIVTKEVTQGSPYPDHDPMRLDSLERLHYYVLRKNFPLSHENSAGRRKKYLDSLVELYPKLIDVQYYKYLSDKSAVRDSTFRFDIKHIKIADSTYRSIIDQINASGYWTQPYHIGCEAMDGFGFILEVNTTEKYNFVGLSNCPEKNSLFSKACRSLVTAAALEKKIKINY
jgi:hypothetical protein